MFLQEPRVIKLLLVHKFSHGDFQPVHHPHDRLQELVTRVPHLFVLVETHSQEWSKVVHTQRGMIYRQMLPCPHCGALNGKATVALWPKPLLYLR